MWGKKALYPALLFLVLAASILPGCLSKPSQENRIKITGSDTMVILGQAWAERYMELHPEKTVSVTGGGSGVGIVSMIDGGTDIAQSSRDMTDTEIKKATQMGINPVKTIPAYDGIAIIVNPDNPVSELSIQEAGGIFTGKTKNWRDVGGKDEGIGLYSRESSSGTFEFMKEHVLGKKDFADSTKYSSGNSAIVESVSQDKTAIGYVGVAYARQREDVKILRIAKNETSAGFLPEKESIKSGDYPISRSLNLYTNGEPSGGAKGFIDFILSDEGKRITEETGYFS